MIILTWQHLQHKESFFLHIQLSVSVCVFTTAMIDFQHFTVKLSESHISDSQFQSLQLKHALYNFKHEQKVKTNTKYNINKAISVKVMTDYTS